MERRNRGSFGELIGLFMIVPCEMEGEKMNGKNIELLLSLSFSRFDAAIAVGNEPLIALLDGRYGRNGSPNPDLISNSNDISGAISATLPS